MLEATQHQRTLYAQLSSLHKFEIKYVTIFRKKHNQFRKSNSFFSKFLMTVVENYHILNYRKSRQKSRSNHEK